jgi:hypothetical protein
MTHIGDDWLFAFTEARLLEPKADRQPLRELSPKKSGPNSHIAGAPSLVSQFTSSVKGGALLPPPAGCQKGQRIRLATK